MPQSEFDRRLRQGDQPQDRRDRREQRPQEDRPLTAFDARVQQRQGGLAPAPQREVTDEDDDLRRRAHRLGMDPYELAQAQAEMRGEEGPSRTIAGRVTEGVKGIPRGLLHNVGASLRGLDHWTTGHDEEGLLHRAGDAVDEYAQDRFEADPLYEQAFFGPQIGEAAGSLSAYAVPGALAGRAAVAGGRAAGLAGRGQDVARRAGQFTSAAPLAAAAGTDEAHQRLNDLRERAPELGLTDEDISEIANRYGSTAGLIQIATLRPLFRFIPAPQRRRTLHYLLERGVKPGMTEFTVENLGGIVQNLAQRRAGDEDVDLLDEVPERGAPAAVAAALMGLATGPGVGGRPDIPEAQRDADSGMPEPSAEEMADAVGTAAENVESDPEVMRERARQYREMAAQEQDENTAQVLTEQAEILEAELAQMDAEGDEAADEAADPQALPEPAMVVSPEGEAATESEFDRRVRGRREELGLDEVERARVRREPSEPPRRERLPAPQEGMVVTPEGEVGTQADLDAQQRERAETTDPIEPGRREVARARVGRQPVPDTQRESDVTRHDGSPYPTERAARIAMRGRNLDDYTPVRVDNGFVLRPVDQVTPDDTTGREQAVDQAAQQTDTDPSPAQIEAGNYRKGSVRLHGMDISIENPAGSVRRGEGPDGPWESRLAHHYGYIRRTDGADGDHVDVFIGPAEASGRAFVIDQVNPETGEFDEHKVMLGFNTASEAREGYLENYPRGWEGVGGIREMSASQLRDWVEEGDTSRPLTRLPESRQHWEPQQDEGEYLPDMDAEGRAFTDLANEAYQAGAGAAQVANILESGQRPSVIERRLNALIDDMEEQHGPRTERAPGRAGAPVHGEPGQLEPGGEGAAPVSPEPGGRAAPAQAEPGRPERGRDAPRGRDERDAEARLTPRQRRMSRRRRARELRRLAGEAEDPSVREGLLADAERLEREAEGERPRMTREERARADRTPDPENDDILAAIAKMGGLDRAEAEAQGIDPAHFNERGHKIFRIFTRDGDSFDGMAERLSELGYPVWNDRGDHDVDVLLSRVHQGLAGENVMAQAGMDREARREAREQELAEIRAEREREREGIPSEAEIEAMLQQQQQYEDAFYEPEAAQEARALHDLFIEAGQIDDAATERVAVQAENNDWSDQQTARRLWEIIHEQEREGRDPHVAAQPQEEAAPTRPERDESEARQEEVEGETASPLDQVPAAMRDMTPQYFQDRPGLLRPRLRDPEAVRQRIEEAKDGFSPQIGQPRADMEGAYHTVEAVVHELENARQAMRAEDGKLRARRGNASPDQLFEQWVRTAAMERRMDRLRQEQPAEWQAYQQRQEQLRELSKGDRVRLPIPSPEHPAGEPGTIVRKGSRNWRIEHGRGQSDLLPIESLAPVDSEPFSGESPPGVREAGAEYQAAPDTEPFKRWFGDSKVVDENGDPLVVYHGTARENIDEFDVGRSGEVHHADWGEGIYLTPSRETAEYYRRAANKAADPESERLFKELERLEKQATWRGGTPTYPEGYWNVLQQYRQARAKAEEGEGGAVMPLYAKVEKPFIIEYQSYGNPGVGATAREHGHDGIFVLKPDGSIDEIVVFSPEQVKSATDNVGTFSPDDPSIVREDQADLFGPHQRELDSPRREQRDPELRVNRDLFEDSENEPSPARKRLAQNAVSDLAQVKILGSRIPREFARDGRVDLVGREIESMADLAVMAQALRDPRFETLRVFWTRGNRVVGQTAISQRLPGSAQGFPDFVNQGDMLHYWKNQMEQHNADGFWMLHNHPSGNPVPSTPDQRITARMQESLAGFKGHVVINQGKYGVIGKMGSVRVHDLPRNADTSYNLNEPGTPHPSLGMTIVSPNTLAKVAKSMEGPTSGNDDHFVMVGVTTRQKLGYIAELPIRLLERPGRLRAVIRRLDRENGTVASFALHIPQRLDYWQTIRDVGVVDAVNIGGVMLSDQGHHQPELKTMTPAPPARQIEGAPHLTRLERAKRKGRARRVREHIEREGLTNLDNPENIPLDPVVREGEPGAYTPESPSLSALHNLTEDNLRFADEIGGLAVPSIAVVRADQSISGFGPITLIGRRDMADPAEVPTFDADVWTATFPEPIYNQPSRKKMGALIKELRPYAERYGDGRTMLSVLDHHAFDESSPDRVASEIRNSQAGMAWFLESNDEAAPAPVVREPDLEMPGIDSDAFRAFMESEPESARQGRVEVSSDQHRRLSDAYRKGLWQWARRQPDADQDWDLYRDVVEGLIDRHLGDDGLLRLPMMDKAIREYNERLGRQEVAITETREALEAAIGGRESEFKDFVDRRVKDAFPEPKLRLGRRKVPYTIDNIVAAMTDGPVEQREEGLVFGTGKTRAASARRLSNLAEARKRAKRQLTSERQAEAAQEQSEDQLQAYRDAVVDYYRWNEGMAGMFDALDASMRSLARMLTGQGGARMNRSGMRSALRAEDFNAHEIPNDVLDQGVAAARALIETPVPYFEAKPQRGVAIGEFAGAIIPENASQRTRETLERHQVPYRQYRNEGTPDEINQDRADKVNELRRELAGQGEDVMFSRTGRPRGNRYTAAQVREYIRPLMREWRAAPRIQVVQSDNQLPKAIRDKIDAADAWGQIAGVWHRGRAYIVADQMDSPRHIEETVAHEVMGHFGLRTLMGRRMTRLLDDVWRSVGRRSLQPVIDSYFPDGSFDASNANHRRTVAEEYLAHLIQTGKKPGIVRRAVAIIRGWLTRMGFRMNLSDAEIGLVLDGARQFVRNGHVEIGGSVDAVRRRHDAENSTLGSRSPVFGRAYPDTDAQIHKEKRRDKHNPPEVEGMPVIEPRWKEMLRLRGFWDSASDILRRSPGLRDVAQAVDRYFDRSRQRMGRVNRILRPAAKQVPHPVFRREENQQVHREFELYQRHKENGRMAQARRVRANMRRETEQLVRAWERVADLTGTENQKLGIRVFDPRTGEWRPIGKAPDFFPRQLRRDVEDVLFNPNKHPGEWDRMVDDLIANGNIESRAEANKYLRTYFDMQADSVDDYFAGVEKARMERLPESWYDYSWEAAMRYKERWAIRVSQIEAFGQKLGRDDTDLFEEAVERTTDQATQEYLRELRNRVYNKGATDPITRFIGNLNVLATGLMLGNPATASLNLIGGTSINVSAYGYKAAIRALKDLRHMGRQIDDAVSRGVLIEDYLAIMHDMQQQGVSERLTQFSTGMLKYGGYTPVEWFIRTHGMLMGHHFLKDAIHHWNRNIRSRKSQQYIAWFQRNGWDYRRLIRENGKGEYTDRFLRYAVNLGQGSYRVNQVPIFTDTPIGRFLFKYQKFGTQLSRMFWRNHLKPFYKAISEGGERVYWEEAGRPVSARVRTFWPMFRFLATFAAGGSALLWLREALFGYQDPGPDWDEIEKALEDDDRARAIGLMMERAFESFLGIGGLGFFGNYMQFLRDVNDRHRVKSPLDPPGLAPIEGVAELSYRFFEHGLGPRDFDDVLEQQFSLYRTGKRASLTGLSLVTDEIRMAELESLSRDRLYARQLSRRYADEHDIEARRIQTGRFGRTEMTPVTQRINEALLLGESENAQQIMRDHLMSLESEAEIDRAIRAIQASARRFQPTRVTTSPSDAERQAFLDWLEQRVSRENYERVRRVDEQFEKAAIRAGILSRRNPAAVMRDRFEREQSERPMSEQERRLYLRLKGIRNPGR